MRCSSGVEQGSHTPRVGSSSLPTATSYKEKNFGGVAQLGERRICTAEAAGSIPVISTTFCTISSFGRASGFQPEGGRIVADMVLHLEGARY